MNNEPLRKVYEGINKELMLTVVETFDNNNNNRYIACYYCDIFVYLLIKAERKIFRSEEVRSRSDALSLPKCPDTLGKRRTRFAIELWLERLSVLLPAR